MENFQNYIKQVEEKPAFWKIFLGLLIIFGSWVLGVILLILINGILCSGSDCDIFLLLDLINIQNSDGDIVGVWYLLGSFWGIWLAVWLVHKYLFKSNFFSLFSSERRFLSLEFLKGILFAGISTIPFWIFGYFIELEYRELLELNVWLLILVPTLVLVFLQVGAEELMFRGYLLQLLAARKHSWIIWAFLPSLGFGILHYDPELLGGLAWLYIISTTIFGLSACVLVRRSGSLWSAIGFHFGINTQAFLISTLDGFANGTQLYLISMEKLDLMLMADVIIGSVMLLFLISPYGNIFNAQKITHHPYEVPE